jgi:hypothetical protein
MFEMSPQLQSQVFDSVLLHMRAELGRAARPHKGGGREAAPTAASGWKNLAMELRGLGVQKTAADALVTWANAQAEQSRRSPVKIRILHPMEREFISVPAYDYLLELYRLGLLAPMQLETLIENCAFLTTLPAGKEQIQKMVLRAFSEQIDSQGLGISH